MSTNKIEKIAKDIEIIDKSIGENKISVSEAGELVEKLVYTYQDDLSGIRKGLDRYTMYGDRQYYEDLSKIKMRLELLLAKLKDEVLSKQNGNNDKSIQIINHNKNDATVKTNINISLTFEEIIKDTEDNPYIGEDLRKEMLDKIKELQKISESNNSRVKKWSSMKNIINWISSQGVDIGIKLLPLIIQSLETV